jgi:hypothetical protein
MIDDCGLPRFARSDRLRAVAAISNLKFQIAEARRIPPAAGPFLHVSHVQSWPRGST